jgi:phosphoglycolate phosphatase
MSDRAANGTPAVIFDLDGTLLDTLEDIAGAMNAVLRARGFPPSPLESYKKVVGQGLEEAVRRAFAAPASRAAASPSSLSLPTSPGSSSPPSAPPSSSPTSPSPGLSDEEVAGIIRDYRREYAAAWRLHSRPYPGIPGLLDALAARGIRAAVLSNKSHPFTEEMVRELLPGHAFAAVRGALPGVPLKPDPAAALAIAAGLGAPPASCLFVGDTNIDMLTAAAAGMVPVGALWGFRDEPELRAHGAAAGIASPIDLLALL